MRRYLFSLFLLLCLFAGRAQAQNIDPSWRPQFFFAQSSPGACRPGDLYLVSGVGPEVCNTEGTGVTLIHTDEQPGAGGGGGTTWYSGSGAPSDGTGANGNYYLRSNGMIYLKASGTWGSPYLTLVLPGGNVATATALAADPANCTAGNVPRGVDATGAAQACAPINLATETTGAAPTAAALAADGTNCSAGNFPLGVDASGNAQNCTRLPQVFFGTASPGSVSGNLSGDLFSDSTNHHVYQCNAPSATAAPACTSVTTGQWMQVDGGGGGGSANPAEFHTITFSTTPAFTPTSSTAGTSDTFTLSTALSANISPTATMANFTPGQEVVVILKQAASGGPYTVTWPTGFTCAGNPSPTANAVTTFKFQYDSAAGVMRCTSTTPDSGPGIIVLQSAPSSPPGAGTIAMWGDTTNTTLQVEDSSGNIYSMPRQEACTNQAVTALGANARITCTTVVSTMTDTSIAHTGVDINTSHQVASTHLTNPLPLAQGGTNCATPYAINPQTATYQVVAADFTCSKTISVASGTFTITLVASGSQPVAGSWIKILNYGTGVVTIARSGQNLNGGTASLTVAAGSATAPTSAEIKSDGTNYFGVITVAAGGSSLTATSFDDMPYGALGVGTAQALTANVVKYFPIQVPIQGRVINSLTFWSSSVGSEHVSVSIYDSTCTKITNGQSLTSTNSGGANTLLVITWSTPPTLLPVNNVSQGWLGISSDSTYQFFGAVYDNVGNGHSAPMLNKGLSSPVVFTGTGASGTTTHVQPGTCGTRTSMSTSDTDGSDYFPTIALH